jgi:hypothetical protein
MAGNANSDTTRDFGQLAREIVAEHKATDEAEDELYGDARGDELPEQLRTPEGRREFFAKAREKLRAAAAEELSEPEAEEPVEPEFEFDEKRIVARTQGRDGWLREARRQLEQHRWQNPDPVPPADRASVAGGRAVGGRPCRGVPWE